MNANKNKHTFIVEKTGTGFSAYSSELPVFTTGQNITELKSNCLEALQLFFNAPHPRFSPSDIRLEIDLQQFFRHYRVLNARFLARRIGLNPSLLSQYVQGHKRPSSKQQEKILRGIQEIGEELVDLGLIVR